MATIRKELEFTTTRDYQGNPMAKTIKDLIHGASTESEAFALLQTTTATWSGDLKIKTYELDEAKGSGAWTFDVNYEKSLSGNPENTSTQQPQYGFNTGSASATMVTPISHQGKYPPNATHMIKNMQIFSLM